MSTDSTKGPGNENEETPHQKRERESREKLNREYADLRGLQYPIPESDTPSDDSESDSGSHEVLDVSDSLIPTVRRDIDDLLDAGQSPDDDSQVPFYPDDEHIADAFDDDNFESDDTTDDISFDDEFGNESDGSFTVNDDTDSDSFYDSDPSLNASADWMDDEDSEADEDDEAVEDDEDDEAVEDDEDDEDDEAVEDDEDDDYILDETDEPEAVDDEELEDEGVADVSEEELAPFLSESDRKKNRNWKQTFGDWGNFTYDQTARFGKWVNNSVGRSATAGVVVAAPVAYEYGQWIADGVAIGDPVSVLGFGGVAGAGGAIVDSVRTLRGETNKWKATWAATAKDDPEGINETLQEKADLINTPEEHAAVRIVERLGRLDIKNFPLLRNEEDYAREIYHRIHPVLANVDSHFLKDSLTQKRLKIGTDLNKAYHEILGVPFHDDSHGDHGHDEHAKPLKKLTEAQIGEISVQLGRMLYTYHMKQNALGRSLNIAGSVVTGIVTGTFVPGIVAAGYEGVRYIRTLARDSESHLIINKEGKIVNRADGKSKLVMPKEDAHDEHHDEHVTQDQLTSLERKKDAAHTKLEKAEKEFKDMETKIEESKITAARLQGYITDIKHNAENRKLTVDQENEIKRLQNQLNMLNADIIDLETDRDNLAIQIRQYEVKIQESTEEISDIKATIKAIESEIGDNDPTDRQRRKLSEAKMNIKEIGLPSLEAKKEGFVTQQKNINKKIRDLERRKGDIELEVQAIMKKAENKQPTADEEKKIKDYEKEIELLKIPTMEIKLPGLKEAKENAEKKFNKLEQDLEKKEEAFEKAKHHKPKEEKKSLATRAFEFVTGSGVGQTVGNYTKDVAVRVAGGAAVGGLTCTLLSQVPLLRPLLGNTTAIVVSGLLVGGRWAYKYVANRMTDGSVKTSTKSHDAHAAPAKKDDHKTDTHH